MKNLSRVTSRLVISSLIGGLIAVGCATKERHVDDIAISPQAGDNPSQEISALEKEVAEGREAGLPSLSPTWYASAEKSLMQAKKLRDEGGNFKDIFKETAEGRAQIQKAREFAGASEKNLSDVLAARKKAWESYRAAEASGATNLNELSGDFNKAEEKFQNLTKAVEDNDTGRMVGERQDAIKAYQVAQGKAMIKEKLDPARRIIGQAEKEDASKYAPKSLASAKEFVSAAEKFIQNSPGSTREVDAQSEQALFYAKRSLELSRQSRTLNDKKPEERVLWVEEGVHGIAGALGAEDHRDQTLDQQFATLKSGAQDVRTRGDGQGKDAKQLASESEQLKSESEQLKSELDKTRAANQSYQQAGERIRAVSSLFTPAEAEVMQKGSDTVVRLKGMKFKSGKAVLGSENFPLLTKVNESLAQFPESNITIEGHTDSVGGEAANMRLSQQRADAVKDYLVSTRSISADRIQSRGFGFSKPIASNKTASGRATNRRIDIVISGAANTQRLGE